MNWIKKIFKQDQRRLSKEDHEINYIKLTAKRWLIGIRKAEKKKHHPEQVTVNMRTLKRLCQYALKK